MNEKIENLSLMSVLFFMMVSLLIPIILLVILLGAVNNLSPESKFGFSSIFIFISLICLFLFVALRYLLREKMMKKLAAELKLDFSTNPPRFLELITPWAWFAYRGDKVNNINGSIGNYEVNISDVLFPKRIVWFIITPYWQYTVVDIREKNNKGEEQIFYKTGRFPIMLKPVFIIRRLLNKIPKV